MEIRAGRLAERLDAVGAGAEPEPLEQWMEELYRRVSDNQTMGSVVDELRSTLGEAEKALDQFFRSPQDTAVLATVPGHLAQMRGVLSVLGLDQASLAVVRMRDMVERLLINEVPESDRQGVFEKLGNSLGALGFLIDMLSYQRTMARKLFVYDEELGELRILTGKTRPRASDALEESNVPSWRSGRPFTCLTWCRVFLCRSRSASRPISVRCLRCRTCPQRPPLSPLAPVEADSLAPDISFDLPAVRGQRCPRPCYLAVAAPAPAPAQVPEVEDELLEVFLEEAREVVGQWAGCDRGAARTIRAT